MAVRGGGLASREVSEHRAWCVRALRRADRTAIIVRMRSAELMETYLLEVVAAGRLELIDELAMPDMVDEANQAFGGPAGRAGLVAHVKGFRKALDGLRLSVDRIVANDDEVMAWWSFAGVHVRPWLGRPPTGGEISGTVFSFFELVDGRVDRYRVWLHTVLDEPVVFDSSRPIVLHDRPVNI